MVSGVETKVRRHPFFFFRDLAAPVLFRFSTLPVGGIAANPFSFFLPAAPVAKRNVDSREGCRYTKLEVISNFSLARFLFLF